MIYLASNVSDLDARRQVLSLCRSGLANAGAQSVETFVPPCLAVDPAGARVIVAQDQLVRFTLSVAWIPTAAEIAAYLAEVGPLFLPRAAPVPALPAGAATP